MTEQIQAVKRIDGGLKPKAAWVQLNDEANSVNNRESVAKEPLTKRAAEVDSLESLATEKSAAKQVRLDNNPGFWAQAWSAVCSLFGYSAAATTATGEGGNSPTGTAGGISPIGSSAPLDAPHNYDAQKFLQMLKETVASLKQVLKPSETAEEEYQQSEQFTRRFFLEQLKVQRDQYDKAAENNKIGYLRHQESQRELRKKLGDTKTEAIESAKSERRWGWWNTTSKFALLTAAIGLVAVSAIGTAGWSIGAGSVAVKLLFEITGPFASATYGATSIMQGAMKQQQNSERSTITLLNHQSSRFSQFIIPEDIRLMKENLDQSFKIVTVYLKRHEEKRNNTIKSIVSDISARG